MQHVTSLSFLLLAYSNYISHSNQLLPCGGISATPAQLKRIAKRQVCCCSHWVDRIFHVGPMVLQINDQRFKFSKPHSTSKNKKMGLLRPALNWTNLFSKISWLNPHSTSKITKWNFLTVRITGKFEKIVNRTITAVFCILKL